MRIADGSGGALCSEGAAVAAATRAALGGVLVTMLAMAAPSQAVRALTHGAIHHSAARPLQDTLFPTHLPSYERCNATGGLG